MHRTIKRWRAFLVLPLWLFATAGAWSCANMLIWHGFPDTDASSFSWLWFPLFGAVAQWAALRCFRSVSALWLPLTGFLHMCGWFWASLVGYGGGMTAMGTTLGLAIGITLGVMLSATGDMRVAWGMTVWSVFAGWLSGYVADQQRPHNLCWGTLCIPYERWYLVLGLWYGLLTGIALLAIIVWSPQKRDAFVSSTSSLPQ